MKKTISFILTFILFCSASVILAFAEEKITVVDDVYYGDVNVDGHINITDVTNLQQYLAKIISADDINYINSCVFGNNILSINDATLIQIRLVNLICFFPVESEHIIEKTMYYGDFLNISDEYQNAVLGKIDYIDNINSFKVENAKVTSSLDKKLFQRISDKELCCVGTGCGYINIVDSDYYEQYQKDNLIKNGVTKIKITVLPAPLTMVFIAGQSNAEGCVNAQISPYKPSNSIACKRGTVYSIYGSNDLARGTQRVTNYSDVPVLTEDNINTVTPSSLSSICKTSISGNTLAYPIDALTFDGLGKTGFDGAFCFRWNKLTGEKVFVVNAAYGGTNISHWARQDGYIKPSRLLYESAYNLYKEEIKSNHFIAKHKLVLWQQGESDYTKSAENYLSDFTSMQILLKEYIDYDYFGMIMIRSRKPDGTAETTDCFTLTGPRVAQSYISNSKNYDNTFLVSTINETWKDDNSITNYFTTKYPEGFKAYRNEYPLRSSSDLNSLPTTYNQIYYNLHFSQIGHNENGFDAANNFYKLIYGKNIASSVNWIDETGNFVSEINIGSLESIKISPRYDVPTAGKNCNLSYDNDAIDYNEYTQTLTAKKDGTYYLDAYNEKNILIGTLTINISS